MSFEIGDGEFVELALTEDRAQPAEIFPECTEDAPPVLLIVDLQSLECGEPVVGLNQTLSDGGPGRLHAFVRFERAKEGAGDGALEFEKRRLDRHGNGRWKSLVVRQQRTEILSSEATQRWSRHGEESGWP